MSSLPLNTASVSLLPANFDTRRANLLQHIAKSAKFADVHPASRLEVRPRPEMLASGIIELDAVMGGIPCGHMTMLYGSASSGKTSALLATLAKNTQDGGTCVLIDASDSFDPKSAAAAGVNFNRLLWVRCGEKPKRSSAAGRPLSAVQDFAYDARRTTHDGVSRSKSREPRADASSSEIRLEQVLKTTDLILQSGGFGLVVLDLAGISEKYVRRIPLASWFRFQRAVEHTKTAMLVVSEFACSQTCAALVLKVGKKLSAAGSFQPSGKPAHAELLEAMSVGAEVVRSRLDRKPMQSVKTSFITRAVRAG